jgi:hypothetical protein
MNILLLAPQPFYTERGTPIAVKLLAQALCMAGHKVDDQTDFNGQLYKTTRNFEGHYMY